MANYDLDRLKVLLVEDSPFIQSLLINALKILGVGTVVAKDHGGEAIEFLKLVEENPMKAGVSNIDIVLTNWDMSPVDGLMLLRWIRRHKDSPDRFVPVVMITAYSESPRVREARELGVNDMLTKPFTITGIGEKLTSIIERPRQFVHTKSYFGPDRRRMKRDIGKRPERRKLTEKSESVEIVRG